MSAARARAGEVPSFSLPLASMGASQATVPPPPAVPRPVSLMPVDPPRAVCQDLVPARLDCERRPPLKLPEDPADVIRKKLSALDCPRKKGWRMNSGMKASVLCKCGGGSHQLSVSEVVAEIQPLGFDGDVFKSFVDRQRHQFEGQDVNAFLHSFMDTDGHDVVAQRLSERQKVQDQIAHEEASWQLLLACKEDLTHQQQELCDGFRADFRDGQTKAEKVFINYCFALASSVPGAEVNIDPESTSVQEAQHELEKAKRLNESRVAAWADWEEAVECWSDVPEVFQHRPDLVNANFDKDDAEAKAEQLRKQADAVASKMAACIPDREAWCVRLSRVQEEWARHVEEYKCG